MRVFVAIMLPDAVRHALELQIAQLRGLGRDLAWEQPERWHITLSFLGDVDSSVVRDLHARLERAASRIDPFTLQLAGLGRFGNRVLNVKIVGDSAALRRLAERTTAASRRAGAELRDERYRPHVTVARSRRGADLRPLVDAGRDVGSTEWTVTDFVVVNSVLGRERRYEILDRYRLGARGSAGSAG